MFLFSVLILNSIVCTCLALGLGLGASFFLRTRFFFSLASVAADAGLPETCPENDQSD